MAIEKKAEVAQPDPWKSAKETWQFVSVPDEDVTGKKYPSIWLNKMEFRSGESYNLPPQIAEYVKDRVKAFNRSVTRLFSPMVDRIALNDVAVGTTSPATPSGDRPAYIDAARVTTL